jgi:uncharacterized protein (TIGR02266 family)
MSEKRAAERLTVNREFETIQEFIAEYVSDISRTGVFIRSDDPLPVGTRVDLRFTVIAGDFETIEGIGEVVRVVEAGGDEATGMGVVFVELTNYSAKLVEQLLTK